MSGLRLLAAGMLLLASAWLQAAELRPFGKGEMARLLAEREGRPFIITFWSTDCPHCKTTLRELAGWAKRHPRLDLVVVNTDSADASPLIATMLNGVGLGARDTWIFAEAPERMRYEIDRRWGGELPRSYLFDGDHRSAAFSGPIDAAALRRWTARNAIDSGAAKRP